MRSLFLALATATTIISSLAAYTYSVPVVELKEYRMWSHIVDPYGHKVMAPDKIRWEVDAASCGSNHEAIVNGMHGAERTWRGAAGIDIQRANGGEPINLAVYCAPFGEKYSESPTSYRIKHLETASNATLTRIAVEVPSNWALQETASYDEVFSAKNAWWNAQGTANYVVGLSLGVTHAYATGKKPRMLPLDDAQRQRVCVKRCDPAAS